MVLPHDTLTILVTTMRMPMLMITCLITVYGFIIRYPIVYTSLPYAVCVFMILYT